MARVAIKRIKVTGWHDDKDTGEQVARLKITFEGESVTGKMHAYIAKPQLDEWAAARWEAEQREITLTDLHEEVYEWLFGCPYEAEVLADEEERAEV